MFEWSHDPDEELSTQVGYIIYSDYVPPTDVNNTWDAVENTLQDGYHVDPIEKVSGPRKISEGYHVSEVDNGELSYHFDSLSIWLIETSEWLTEVIAVGEVSGINGSQKHSTALHDSASTLRNFFRDKIIVSESGSFQNIIWVAPDEDFYDRISDIGDVRDLLKMGPSREYLKRLVQPTGTTTSDIDEPVGLFEREHILSRVDDSSMYVQSRETRFVCISRSAAALSLQLLEMEEYNSPFEFTYLTSIFAVDRWLEEKEPTINELSESVSDVSSALPVSDERPGVDELSDLSKDIYRLQERWIDLYPSLDRGHSESRERIKNRRFELESTAEYGVSHYGYPDRFRKDSPGFFEEYISSLKTKLQSFRSDINKTEDRINKSSQYFEYQSSSFATYQSIDSQKSVENLTKVVALLTVIIVSDIFYSWLPLPEVNTAGQTAGTVVIAYLTIISMVVILAK